MKELYNLLDQIPGADGWYKESTKESYRKAGRELSKRGMTHDIIYNCLESLYWATAAEFGN